MGFLNRTITKIFKNPTLGHPNPTKELPKEPLKKNLHLFRTGSLSNDTSLCK